MNAYLPTEPHTVNFDDSELMEVLCEITNIIEKSGYTDVILNGDLNWVPSRNTGFSNTVRHRHRYCIYCSDKLLTQIIQ